MVDHIKAHSFNTQLKDRTLYYDGDSVVTPDRVLEFIDRGLSEIYVTEETAEIKQHNQFAKQPIKRKSGNRPLKFNWNIPEPYYSLDPIEYIIDKWADELVKDKYSSEEADIRAKRISDELQLYKNLQLLPILRAIIYIINTLEKKNIVWGVGRGSSVSSYVLYLIGVHDVDSVKYDLDFTDFLR